MDILKKLVLTLFSALVSFSGHALEMKGPDGKYRHHDPAVRAELLSIAHTLYANDMPDKAIKLYRVLAKKWQAADQRPDQRKACQAVLGVLVDKNRLDEWPTHMAGCAPAELEQHFLDIGANITSLPQLVNHYLYLVANSDKFSYESTKNIACAKLGALQSRFPEAEFPQQIAAQCPAKALRRGMLSHASATIPVRQLVSRHLSIGLRVGMYEDSIDLEAPLTAAHQQLQNLINQWQQPEESEEKAKACSLQTQLLHWANRFDENSPWLAGCSPKSIHQGICDFATEFSYWYLATWRRALPGEERLAMKIFSNAIPQFLAAGHLDVRDAACVSLSLERDLRNSKADISDICTPSQIRRGKIMRAEIHEYLHQYDEAQRQYRRFISEWQAPEAEQERLIACQLLKWHTVKQVKKNSSHLLGGCDKSRLVDSPEDPKLAPAVANYIQQSHYRRKMMAERQYFQKQWQGQLVLRNAAVPRIIPAINKWLDSAEIQFDVSKWGRVTNMKVVTRADTRSTERLIKRILSMWRFEPKIVDGKPVEVKGLRVWLGYEEEAILRFSDI